MPNHPHPIDIAELRRLLLDLDKLQAWLREPDWAETFGTREITDWLNNRPTAVLPSAIGKISVLLDRIEAEEWRPIESAPYSQEVIVRAGSMTFRAELVPDASINRHGSDCDQWQATIEGEHPPCWSGGACWESNEDEVMSLQPDAWRPAPTTGGANG